MIGCDPRQFIFECSYVCRDYNGSFEWIVLCNDNDTDKFPTKQKHIRGKVYQHGFIVRVEEDQTMVYFIEHKDYFGYINALSSHSNNQNEIQQMLMKIKKAFNGFEEWKGIHDSSPFNSFIN